MVETEKVKEELCPPRAGGRGQRPPGPRARVWLCSAYEKIFGADLKLMHSDYPFGRINSGRFVEGRPRWKELEGWKQEAWSKDLGGGW